MTQNGFRTPDVEAWLDRMMEIARAQPPAPEPTAEEVRSQRQRERNDRLLLAGYVGAIDRAIVAKATDKPPIINGHEGNRVAYRALFQWLRDKSLVAVTLWGPTGTGKSLAAAWAIADTERAFWLQADEADADRQRWERMRSRAISAPVCVINDLGDEDRWASRRLAAVIRRRIDDGKRTIITTNLPVWARDVAKGAPTERCIQVRYEDRVADRLGRGRVLVAFCGGESLRGVK